MKLKLVAGISCLACLVWLIVLSCMPVDVNIQGTMSGFAARQALVNVTWAQHPWQFGFAMIMFVVAYLVATCGSWEKR